MGIDLGRGVIARFDHAGALLKRKGDPSTAAAINHVESLLVIADGSRCALPSQAIARTLTVCWFHSEHENIESEVASMTEGAKNVPLACGF
jgi:hypothetical protein